MKSIDAIVKHTIKQSGFNADANCSGGRCHEFAEALHKNLTKHGHKSHLTSSHEWIRGHATKHKKKVGYAEAGALEDNPHAWVYVPHTKKHYDALNPNGAERPSKMNFYKGWTHPWDKK